MIELLAAGGPDPRLRDELALYGQFVGSWSVESRELAPSWGEFAHQVGRAEGDRIVKEGSGRRWTFFDIEPDAFRWTGERHEDGDWRLVQELSAVRV